MPVGPSTVQERLVVFVPGLTGAFAGIALWGLHMALSQGLLAKLVADRAPESLRGTAYGVFNLATGVALLLASVTAGLLWDLVGPNATFVAGAAFAGAAMLMLAFTNSLRARASEVSRP